MHVTYISPSRTAQEAKSTSPTTARDRMRFARMSTMEMEEYLATALGRDTWLVLEEKICVFNTAFNSNYVIIKVLPL